MTGWTFTVGADSESGTPNWNANWTLNNLVITDGFNSGGTQTCNFNPSSGTGMGYDDWGRLLNDNCVNSGQTGIWSQTFGYDQYDNIWKTGSITWACSTCYNQSTNQYNSSLSGSISYDASGNLLDDTFHEYTWNQFNQLNSVDSTACGTNGECVTYDAFGRPVEVSKNSAFTEIWYTQFGKTAYMNGSTINYGYWPTPGGSTVALNGDIGSFEYVHNDWLGNARVTSYIKNHTVNTDQAYAPYGEIYNQFGSTVAEYKMFTGDTQDIVSGTYDTPNRELNPNQGRWISPDPAGAGWNQYAYLTNPLNATDPSGLSCYPMNGFGAGDSSETICSGFAVNAITFPTDYIWIDGQWVPLDGWAWWDGVIPNNRGNTSGIPGGNGIFPGQDFPWAASLSSQIAGLLGSIFPCSTDFGAPCNPIGAMGIVSGPYANNGPGPQYVFIDDVWLSILDVIASPLAANNGIPQPPGLPGVPKPPTPILNYDKCVTQNVNPAKNNAQKVSILNGVTNLNGLGLCALTGPDAPLCVGVLGGVATVNSLVFWAGGQITVYDAETQCLQQN
jgi:RHS repeat-associated protein